jgi:hypothetical protein
MLKLKMVLICRARLFAMSGIDIFAAVLLNCPVLQLHGKRSIALI